MQGLAGANRRVIDELPTVAVVSGILSGNLDASADDDRARARTWASRSALIVENRADRHGLGGAAALSARRMPAGSET